MTMRRHAWDEKKATIFEKIVGWDEKEETAIDIVEWDKENVFHPMTLEISFLSHPRTMLVTSGRAAATIVGMLAAAGDDNLEQ